MPVLNFFDIHQHKDLKELGTKSLLVQLHCSPLIKLKHCLLTLLEAAGWHENKPQPSRCIWVTFLKTEKSA